MPALHINFSDIETIRKIEPTARKCNITEEENQRVAKEVAERTRTSNRRFREQQLIARATFRRMILKGSSKTRRRQ